MFLLAQDPKRRPSIDECVCDLEQFLAQLPRDAEGTVGSPPPLAGRPKQLHVSLAVDVSNVCSSSSSSPPHLNSSTSYAPPVSPPLKQPPSSLAVDVSQLSALQPSDICILMHAAGPDFEAKGYGKAAETNNVTGDFIVKANEVELSLLFNQMGVKAVDMPTLREAVASWKANPAQAFNSIAVERERAEAAARRAAEAKSAAQAVSKVRSGDPPANPKLLSYKLKPQTPNTKPRTPNPKPQTPNLPPLSHFHVTFTHAHLPPLLPPPTPPVRCFRRPNGPDEHG